MRLRRVSVGCGVVLALVAAGCDKSQLLAPSDSTVRLTTASSFVPTGGTTVVTAFVAESSGTPVQNGTAVRFTTNLGRVEPVEVQTRNGYAEATFVAGDASGVAQLNATSGGIGGTTDSGTTGATATNTVQITVGAAAVETVVLSANPSTVPAGGGTVNLVAIATNATGGSLPGVAVSFVTSAGQLGDAVVTTDASGQARTTLTTDRTTTVTAQAGTKTSNQLTINANVSFTASLTATGDAVTPGVGQRWTFTAAISPANDTSAQPVQFDWSFGDGENAQTNSPSTAHVYSMPSSSPSTVRTVAVSIRLSNGQTLTASTQILLGAF